MCTDLFAKVSISSIRVTLSCSPLLLVAHDKVSPMREGQKGRHSWLSIEDKAKTNRESCSQTIRQKSHMVRSIGCWVTMNSRRSKNPANCKTFLQYCVKRPLKAKRQFVDLITRQSDEGDIYLPIVPFSKFVWPFKWTALFLHEMLAFKAQLSQTFHLKSLSPPNFCHHRTENEIKSSFGTNIRPSGFVDEPLCFRIAARGKKTFFGNYSLLYYNCRAT